MRADGHILVLGGNSRLAHALRRHLPADARFVARGSAMPDCEGVDDYGAMPSDVFAGAGTVINCVGVVAADVSQLHEVNARLTEHLARAARSRGGRRFIHVSSLSVYGRSASIYADTPTAPVTPYGRSKLAGDEALMRLDSAGFATATVRFPAIVGAGGRDKLASLVRLWRGVRILPVPRRPVHRSMISIDLAARVLADVAGGDRSGILHAADRELFTYERAASAISQATGRAVRLVRLSDPAFAPFRLAAPGAFTSLFADSVLAPPLNVAGAMEGDLYPTIKAMALGEQPS